MTRILVTGAGGFLGHNLLKGLCRGHELYAGYHVSIPEVACCTPIRFDITRIDQVLDRFLSIRPELVVHSAALSRPDECEQHPDRAHAVIVDGSRNIAEACARVAARLVHISTDLVFDGERGWYGEESEVSGISAYARAKIGAERVVQDVAPASIILRVALLYGVGNESHPGSLVGTVRSWGQGKVLTFYTDQYRTPAFAPQVCEVVQKLIAQPAARGIFHLGGSDRLSRFEFAAMLADRLGIPSRLLRPGRVCDAPVVARRGADCSLDSGRIQAVLGVKPLRCREGLEIMALEGQFDGI